MRSHITTTARNGALVALFAGALLGCAATPTASPATGGLDAVLAETPARPAEIEFAALGGIRSWHALGTDGLLIEGRSNRWYLARFFGSCPEVRFAEAIGFATGPGGDLTKFDSIVVRDRQCHFKTLDEVSADEAKVLRAAD